MSSLSVSSSSPEYSPDVSALLEDIINKGKAWSHGNAAARVQLLDAARSLCHEVETPVETMLRMIWAEVNLNHNVIPELGSNAIWELACAECCVSSRDRAGPLREAVKK